MDFLSRFLTDLHKDMRTTIIFWMIVNFIFATVFVIGAMTAMIGGKEDFRNAVQIYIPNGARLAVNDGALDIHNIPDPSLQVLRDDDDTQAVFIVDTRGDTYSLTTLDGYAQGIALLSDKAYIKADDSKIESVAYRNVPNFIFSKEEFLDAVDRYFVPVIVAVMIVTMLFLFVVLVIGRSLLALWWALVLVVTARVMRTHVSYRMAYLSVLNFYFVPTLVTIVLIPFAVQSSYLTLAVFLVVFVTNIMWMNRNRQEKVAPPVDDVAETDAAVRPDTSHVAPSDHD